MNHPAIIHVTLREPVRLGPRRGLDDQTSYYDAEKHQVHLRHGAEGVLVYERTFVRDEQGDKHEQGGAVLRTVLPWGIVKQAFYADGTTLDEAPKGKAGK